MRKRILLSGGGTGGHIYPALAIADELKRRFPDAEIRFAGTQEGLESQIVPQAGYQLELLRAAGIERRFTLDNIKNLSQATSGLWDAYRLLKRFGPDVVIGTGGYVCGPLLLNAGLQKLPILLQEQNAVLGVTNRLVQRFAGRIALGAGEAVSGISGDMRRVKVTGNPVRPEFFSITRQEARAKMGLKDEEKLIVLAGGSRGARSLNHSSMELHRMVEANPNYRLIHATGSSQWEEIEQIFLDRGLSLESTNRKTIPYLENMPEVLRGADFIVSRAGALALAEIAVCGVPSLLIPYPHAAENHQEANAKAFVRAGAADLVMDRELNGSKMVESVEKSISDSKKWSAMQAGALTLGKPDATKMIADLAVELIEGVDIDE